MFKIVLALSTYIRCFDAANSSPWSHLGNGECRVGKKGRIKSKSVKLLNVANLDACKVKCESLARQCDGIEWYVARDVYDENYISKAAKMKAVEAGGVAVPDWNGKGWRQQPKGQPNCVLQRNSNNGEWITQSSGLTVAKLKEGLKNAVECHAKNEEWFGTKTTTAAVAERAAQWSYSYTLVGSGACKVGPKKKLQSLTILKLKNVQMVDQCATKCDDEGHWCVGFHFKPNVRAVPGGKWRKAKKGSPNCKLLTHTRGKPKGPLLSEITGSSGTPKKATKPDFTMCYSKDIVPPAPTRAGAPAPTPPSTTTRTTFTRTFATTTSAASEHSRDTTEQPTIAAEDSNVALSGDENSAGNLFSPVSAMSNLVKAEMPTTVPS